MLTLRHGCPVFFWWVAACAAGGALAALDPTALFLGFPVLFGALLGAVQALVLRRYLPGIGPSWVAASFFGWVAGSLLQVFSYELLPAPGFPGGGLLVESLPWVSLGVAQAAALGAKARRRPGLAAAPVVAPWALASITGGTLTVAAVVLTTRPFYGALGGALGEYGTAAAQLAVLVAILYAAPTGWVLALLLGRARAGEARPDARTPSRPAPRAGVAAAVGLLVVTALGILGAWGVTTALGCGPGERQVFSQFPQYGGRTPELRSNLEAGFCFARFVTRAPEEEVHAYYEERLRERGWEVRVREDLVATKPGRRSYWVRFEDYGVPGGRPVTVFVSG